jgi:hypothetical protein
MLHITELHWYASYTLLLLNSDLHWMNCIVYFRNQGLVSKDTIKDAEVHGAGMCLLTVFYSEVQGSPQIRR